MFNERGRGWRGRRRERVFFHEQRSWGGRGFLSGSGETRKFKIAGKRQRGGCRVCLWLEVATGGESLRLVPGSAGSHIPPLPIVCGATLLCSRVYGGGEGKARERTHTDRSALHSDVCLNPSAAPAGEGRGGEVEGIRKNTARFILSGCSLGPALEE